MLREHSLGSVALPSGRGTRLPIPCLVCGLRAGLLDMRWERNAAAVSLDVVPPDVRRNGRRFFAGVVVEARRGLEDLRSIARWDQAVGYSCQSGLNLSASRREAMRSLTVSFPACAALKLLP